MSTPLRRYSVVPVITRVLTQDDELMGQSLPAGIMVAVVLQVRQNGPPGSACDIIPFIITRSGHHHKRGLMLVKTNAPSLHRWVTALPAERCVLGPSKQV